MAEKEYIERGAAKDAIFEYICGHTMSKFSSKELLTASKMGAEGAFNELDYVPAADVVEVRREEWKKVYQNKIATVYECSNCQHLSFGTSEYCICGAKMDGERKERE